MKKGEHLSEKQKQKVGEGMEEWWESLSDEERAEIKRKRREGYIRAVNLRRLKRTKKEVLDRRLHIPTPKVEMKIVDGRQVFVVKKRK